MLWSDSSSESLIARVRREQRRLPNTTIDGMAREIGRLNDYIAALESELRQLHAEREQS
jgi:hypothetical protein